MTSAIGKVIGQYRVEQALATGALGQTVRAVHLRTGEVVAIKLFHERLTREPAFAEQFRPIVEEAASIAHPNVLAVREFGEKDGQYFVRMDFVAAGSLRTLLSHRDSALPLRRALEIGRQAADALAAAHARGVLHRDLKPENILINERGAVDVAQVADFGLTRLADTGLTIDGSMAVGSLPYMSPEQLRGLPLDVRSDVYSLGVVLYEIATGFPPFQVRNLGDAISKHVSVAPQPPRSLLPAISPGLEQVILRALEKDPSKRIQTAAELSALLQSELDRLPGQPLVVWRGAEVAPPLRRMMPVNDRAAAPSRQRFALVRAVVSAEDPTLPPSVEPERVEHRPVSGVSRRIGVVLEREMLSLVPGQLAVLTVTLMNSGRTVDAFGLAVDGVDASWVQTPTQPQRLNPGQRAVVPLSICVPKVPSSRAQTYPVSILARSRENPGEEGSAPATFVVQPFAQTTMALAPPKARGWTHGEYTVALSNQGNAPARYAVSGHDDEKALGYELGAAVVALEPGAALDIPLTTSSRLRAIGGAEIRTFTVTATSQNAGGAAEPPKTVVGQFVHRALIPTWLPPLLIMAALAAFFFISRRNQLSLAVVPQSVQLAVGTSAPLTATLTNGKNEVVTKGPPITWSSGDTLRATVSDEGVVSGVHEGAALITARAGKKTQTVQVTVTPATVFRVELSPKRLTLNAGSTSALHAVAMDSAGHVLPRDPIWMSSDPTVATVGGGRIAAKAAGTATITAQFEAKAATSEIKVVGIAPLPTPTGPTGPTEDCLAYNPASISIAHDKALGWQVVDGQKVIASLDRESEAQQALILARRYKSHCFLGRSNTRPNHNDFIIDYWLTPTNNPGGIPDEDCTEYDSATLAFGDMGASGFGVRDNRRQVTLADTKADAEKAWTIAKAHRALCTIGRRNKRPNQRDYMVQYWR